MTSTPKYVQALLSSRRNINPAILQKLGDGVPEVKRADNEQRNHHSYRGFRGGRGHHRGGGGFAHRSFATAGLVRGGGANGGGANGDA